MHRLLSLAMTASLAVAGALPVPATAAAEPNVIDIPLGDPTVQDIHRTYDWLPIPVGVAELTVVADGYDAVDCFMTTRDFFDDVGYGTDPITADTDVLEVNSDEVVSGGEYRLHCVTATDTLHWWLVASLPAASAGTVSLADSVLREISEASSFDAGSLTLRPGGAYRFVAEPGQLPTADVHGLLRSSDLEITFGGESSSTGGWATFVLPPWESLRESGEPSATRWRAFWNMDGPAEEREGVPLYRFTGVEASVTVLPAASSTRVALSTSLATSVQRVKAIVRVTAPDPGGTVVVKVDGRRVATAQVPAGSDGRIVVTLPKLPRGLHRVTAEYGGAPWIAPSTSPAASVRVLI